MNSRVLDRNDRGQEAVRSHKNCSHSQELYSQQHSKIKAKDIPQQTQTEFVFSKASNPRELFKSTLKNKSTSKGNYIIRKDIGNVYFYSVNLKQNCVKTLIFSVLLASNM